MYIKHTALPLRRGKAGGDDHHSHFQLIWANSETHPVRPALDKGKQSCDTLAVTPPESPALLAVGAGQMGWAFLAFNSFSSLLLSFPWRDWTCPLYTRWAVVRYPLFKCHSLQSWVSHLQCSSPVPPNNLACFFFYCWLLVRDTDLQQTVITEVITRYIICF